MDDIVTKKTWITPKNQQSARFEFDRSEGKIKLAAAENVCPYTNEDVLGVSPRKTAEADKFWMRIADIAAGKKLTNNVRCKKAV